MNQKYFQADDWYRALSLTERIASLQRKKNRIPKVEIDKDLAQLRLERWRNQPCFKTDLQFDQRLAIDGITKEEFLFLLGEPIEVLKECFPETPVWLEQLEQTFSAPNSQLPYLSELTQTKDNEKFLYLIEPLLAQGYERLSVGINTIEQHYFKLPFDPKTVKEILLANLSTHLLTRLGRTLVLELNVARLQGVLIGDTPQERFHSFVQRLRQPDVAFSLLQEYPVLARQIAIDIDDWVTFSLEFLQHLCVDWDEIKTRFSPEREPGLLVELNFGAGDNHRQGRSVIIPKFSSGFQIVYKPRSLEVDVHFQELLAWLNQREEHPGFQIIKVLNCRDYGWLEFVSPGDCKTEVEIERFYERQGGYLALLYALQATDFHSENLIAAGEQPILIDLESLFHPKFTDLDTSQANLLASNKMVHSVLNIGLLPARSWRSDDAEGIDITGLGGKKGQLSSERLPYWQETGTDRMRLERKRMEIPGDLNQPTLNGKNVNLLAYTELIIKGFTNIYQLLLKYRDELLSPEGPVAAFAEDEVRVILRDTYIYALLLEESFHPDVLRDALERDRHFDKLWFQVQHRSYLKQTILAEREDLLRGDIPMFVTRPNSRDLWSSSNQQIRDFLPQPSIKMVFDRLQQLSDADLKQQLWFVRASLATVSMDAKDATFPKYQIQEPKLIPSPETLLTAACQIGDRLEQLAVHGKTDVSWIGLSLVGEEKWSLVTLGINLYDDLPGIVLFLAYLGHVTGKKRYTNLAQAGLTTILGKIEHIRPNIKLIGGFEGWGGIIYTLSHLAMLWNQPDLLTEAKKMVELLPNLIDQDQKFDIIGGAAGCIGSLLSLYQCRPDERTLAVAIKCGEHLINQAQTMKRGIGWSKERSKEKPLAGFSHGAAGIASALLELASLTGEKRFQDAALSSIEYERSLFCSEVNNWKDLRNFADTVVEDLAPQPDSYLCAWCNGAPGIGLARLRSLPHLDNAEIRSEINTALDTTLNQGFGGNHSLCHGDLGNLELLLQASITLKDTQWKTQVNRFAAIILESINQHGWLCGVPLGVETPGLMCGLAGIGYGLIRLAAPENIPSVLVLEAPKLDSKINQIDKNSSTRSFNYTKQSNTMTIESSN